MLHVTNKLGLNTVLGCRSSLVTLSYDRFLVAVISIPFQGTLLKAVAVGKLPANNTLPFWQVPTVSPLLFKVGIFLMEGTQLILEAKRYIQDRTSFFYMALTLFLLTSWKNAMDSFLSWQAVPFVVLILVPVGLRAEIFPSFLCPVHFVQSAKKLSNGIFAAINLDWAEPGDMEVKGSGVCFPVLLS